MGEVSFTVPLVPPSVNSYVRHTRRGGHYVTKEAKAFKEAIGACCAGNALCSARYEIGIAVYLGKSGRGDIDNFPKLVLDGLVSSAVIHSDAAVEKLTVEKFRDRENPRTEITVREL